MSVIILNILLTITVAAAFTHPQSLYSSSTQNQNAAIQQLQHYDSTSSHFSRPTSSSLFMNKKKKKPRSKSNNNSVAFGGVSSSPSPTASSSSTSSSTATLVKPKTTPNFRYAGTIKPGLQSPKRIVPGERSITFPDYANDGVPKNRPALFPWVIEVKKADEIDKMRESGRCAREVLDLAGRAVKAGITT